MKTIGIVSCNTHVNFTNYGSALQSWALCRSVENLGYVAKLVDYCPPMMEDRDILNPMKHRRNGGDGYCFTNNRSQQ